MELIVAGQMKLRIV